MEQTLTKEEYSRHKEEEKEAVFELLDSQTILDMHEPTEFRQLLQMVGPHVATTVSNAILVQAQMPDATAVLSIKEWESRNVPVPTDANGYYPTGIYQITANGEYLGKDGRPHKKYKVYKGYDASQTSDPDSARAVATYQPSLPVGINGVDPQTAINIALYNSSPVKCLKYDPRALIDPAEEISEEVGLRYIPETKTVVVRRVAREEWFPRLAYEIVQGIYHKENGTAYRREACDFDAAVTASLLCIRLGVPNRSYRFGALSPQLAELPPAEIRHRLQKCAELAHELAYRLEQKMRQPAPAHTYSAGAYYRGPVQ